MNRTFVTTELVHCVAATDAFLAAAAVLRGGETSAGYICSSDPRVHLGLGANTLVSELDVRWPSGRKQVLHDVKADQALDLKEPDA